MPYVCSREPNFQAEYLTKPAPIGESVSTEANLITRGLGSQPNMKRSLDFGVSALLLALISTFFKHNKWRFSVLNGNKQQLNHWVIVSILCCKLFHCTSKEYHWVIVSTWCCKLYLSTSTERKFESYSIVWKHFSRLLLSHTATVVVVVCESVASSSVPLD